MKGVITCFLYLFCPIIILGQSIDTEFGKNRVQFHDDFKYWDKYESENFITYWYGKGRNVAQSVIQMAELHHDEIQNILEHKINDKIEILVYLDVTDMKQSNIGSDETFISVTGETKIVGNKMFVYFNGDHQHLLKQVREGIASVYLNAMLFGSNIQEILQNAVLLDIPDWFKKGIIAYVTSNWDHLIDDELRDILERDDKYYDFQKLAEDHPRVAGHSMWYYLDQNYGKSSISNLLYLTRITRSLENAFIYVHNSEVKYIMQEWTDYIKQHYRQEKGFYTSNSRKDRMDLGNKDYVPVSKIQLSPDGNYLAYVYNELGKYKVIILDLKSGDRKTIFKYGHKNAVQETDYNYPLLAWHDYKHELTVCYEHKDQILLRKINIDTKEYIEQLLPENIQRIYSLSYYGDLEYFMSANDNGFSDLFFYNVKGREFQKLTNDFYDDLDAHIVNLDGVEGILFSSNRKEDNINPNPQLDTILPIDNFDLFFYDLQKDDMNLMRLTSTPSISERQPFMAGSHFITYLAHPTGIQNRYIYDYKHKTSYGNSDRDRNIILHHSIKDHDKYVSMYYKDGAYQVYLEEPNFQEERLSTMTPFYRQSSNTEQSNILFLPTEEEVEQKEEIKPGQLFVTDFPDPENLEVIDDRKSNEISFSLFNPEGNLDDEDKEQGLVEFNSARITASRLKFRLDKFTTKLDNDVLFEGLESYVGDNNELNYIPMGILLKGTVKDLFEDYIIEAGARYPTTFNGSEYFLTFENRKKRIDKTFALYRRSFTDDVIDPSNLFSQRTKKNTLLGMAQFKYPFNIYRSLRFSSTLRLDRYYFQSTDENSFGAPIVNEKRIAVKAEYVYDNTIDIALNLKHGTRYKIYLEAINRFNLQFVDGFQFDHSLGFTTVLGFDARHYIPVLRHSILALRAAGAASFGSERIIYYLGGMDNWVFPKFDDGIPIPPGPNFAYKTAASHLRGFNYNIRNGSTFGLVNAEFRLPVFRYLLGPNRGASFFKNMQFTAFYDAGIAFHGWSPFDDENPLNVINISSPPVVELEVNYFRDPLVMGYGFGVRTTLLGYFMKFDYAWGIETRRIQDPKIYLSMGMDF